MNKSTCTETQPQWTRSKHEIYISSIGKLLGKNLICHLDKDKKEVLYEKKQASLKKVLLRILRNLYKDAFQRMVRFTQTNRIQTNKIFLPQAILRNDKEVMKSFREKLASSQVDRYISLHLHVPRSKSTYQQKSHLNESAVHKQKDIDSTGLLENRHKSTHYSKSIDIIKIKQQQIKTSEVKVFSYDMTESKRQNQANRSLSKNKKRDIIHITYTEVNLGPDKTPSAQKSIDQRNKSRQSIQSIVRVKQFNVNEFSEVTDFFNNNHDNPAKNQIKFRNNTNFGGLSPHIGKNRIRNSRVINNHSIGREFQNIDLHHC